MSEVETTSPAPTKTAESKPAASSLAPVAKPPRPSFARRHKKKLIALAIFLILPIVMHFGIAALTRLTPPGLPDLSAAKREIGPDGIAHVGHSYKRSRGKI